MSGCGCTHGMLMMLVLTVSLLARATASTSPKVITRDGDVILLSDVVSTIKIQRGAESKDLWEMANEAEVQSSIRNVSSSVDALNTILSQSLTQVERNQSVLRLQLEQSLSQGVQSFNLSLMSSMSILNQNVGELDSQVSMNNSTLTKILNCNSRGLLFDRTENACSVAVGAVQQLNNFSELTAAYESGQTGLFYVKNESTSLRQLFYSPEPDQMIRFDGTSVTPTSWRPPDPFGSGTDGDFITDSSTTWTNTYDAKLIASASRGVSQVSISRAVHLSPGDVALIVSLTTPGNTGSTNGTYELVHIDSVSGLSVRLRYPLENTFMVAPGAVVRFQKVPQYRNVRINHVLRASDWNGETGGIIAFMASDTVMVNAAVSATGSGYRGGWSRNRHSTAGEGTEGYQGSFTTESWQNNGGGGGGGRACSWSQCGYWCGDAIAGGGAGGGHASAGERPGSVNTRCHTHSAGNPDGSRCRWAEAGGALGDEQMRKMHFGGGGGARGGEWNCNQYSNGGRGGGMILIIANSTRLTSNIEANGDAGSNPYCHDAGGSGGGAGGSIFLKTNNLQMSGSNRLRATGGGGLASGGWCNQNARGGRGSSGRIRVDFNRYNNQARNNAVAQLGAGQVAVPAVTFSAPVRID